LIDTGVFYLMKQSRKTKEDDSWTMNEQAERIVSNLVQKCDSSSLVIAVGNGTASRPTQCAIASLIKRNIFAPITVKFWSLSTASLKFAFSSRKLHKTL
uniref:Tex_YqgF domain-containing protein n=1 Tax=Anisakis simplex TaxID=6269 RepID=A0A0M3JP89_ANISI